MFTKTSACTLFITSLVLIASYTILFILHCMALHPCTGTLGWPLLWRLPKIYVH
jgi:hypothetical protein